MQTSNKQVMDQLQTIQAKTNNIKDILLHRLPNHRHTVLAEIAAKKWITVSLRDKDMETSLRKAKTNLGVYRQRVLEQVESLTKLLFALDDIHSDGDESVRVERKAAVQQIQELLAIADALVAQCEHLKQFAHDHLLHVLDVKNDTVVNQAATDEAEEPTVPTDQDMTASSQPTTTMDNSKPNEIYIETSEEPESSPRKYQNHAKQHMAPLDEDANHIFVNAPRRVHRHRPSFYDVPEPAYPMQYAAHPKEYGDHPMEYSPAQSFYGWPHQVPMQRPMRRATFGEPFPARSMFGEPMGFYRTPVW
ncbi:hypothetical protein LEN26_020517 [Aphanomyces euteiches]|nr:hypothetical protein LEN26_020517 [Aphanomyces euteiches]